MNDLPPVTYADGSRDLEVCAIHWRDVEPLRRTVQQLDLISGYLGEIRERYQRGSYVDTDLRDAVNRLRDATEPLLEAMRRPRR